MQYNTYVFQSIGNVFSMGTSRKKLFMFGIIELNGCKSQSSTKTLAFACLKRIFVNNKHLLEINLKPYNADVVSCSHNHS